MRFAKFVVFILMLGAVFAGVAFVQLNLSKISGLLQNFAVQNGWAVVEVVQVPVSGDPGGRTTQTPEVITSNEPLDSANLPPKLEPEEKKVSAPAVNEMPAPAPGQVFENGALTREGVIALTNGQRQDYLGAGFSLIENRQLDIAAANKVKDMFSRQYFEHMSPIGNNASYFVGETGYKYIIIGENLALGNYENDADLVKAWMDSPGHRENILKPGYKEIGVAVGFGMFKGKKTWLAVQEFGTPKSACPKISGELSAAIDAGKKTMDQFSARQKLLLEKINGEKTLAATLESDLKDLIAARGLQAAIKAKSEELNIAISAVNSLVREYNAQIAGIKDTYEAYKSNISQYNQQVNAYNACADKLE
ncbi:MAG: CAP domain-containing protein [Candidatus Paceibacterota bacterium]